MCEIIDFLGPGEKGLDDNLSPEAGVEARCAHEGPHRGGGD
jgi:hypothetical protein